MSTAKPRARSCRPANRPLIEPPITMALFFGSATPISSTERFELDLIRKPVPTFRGHALYCASTRRRNAMALTMLDKKTAAADRSEWPSELKAEFERESRQNNGCVGSQLLSETDKVRI